MIRTYDPKPRSEWPYFAGLLAVFVAMAVAAVFELYSQPRPKDQARRLQGCLEWCRSHGDHATPVEYLVCARGCEDALTKGGGAHVD
jgi:hypothetical protein